MFFILVGGLGMMGSSSQTGAGTSSQTDNWPCLIHADEPFTELSDGHQTLLATGT